MYMKKNTKKPVIKAKINEKGSGAHSKYNASMCAELESLYEQGLTLKLIATRFEINVGTLHSWLLDAEKHGKKSKFYDFYQARERAKTNRALRLIKMLEKAAQNRAPQYLARMLRACDDEYNDLDAVQTNNNQSNNNSNSDDTQKSQLTESERIAAIAALIAR